MENINAPSNAAPKKPGRPRKAEEKKLIQKSMRLTAKQWEKVEYMGLHRLRQLIDKYELD